MADNRRNTAHHASTTNTSTKPHGPEPLPPDVAASRKHRINNDLVTLFKRPCLENSQPTAQGIGLYTHVKGRSSNPVFLPIGGPNRIAQNIKLDSWASSEVKETSKRIKEAVNEEEKIMGTADMKVEELKERYGGLDVPKRARVSQPEGRMQQLQLSMQDASMQDDIANQTATMTPGFAGRRQSLGVGAFQRSTADTDVTMGGTEPARRGSLPLTGNIYHENRDPRLQR